MRAIVADRFGGPEVLRLAEIEKPTVAEGNVLVRVRASSVNPYDWHYLTGLPKLFRPAFGFRRPKYRVLGADLAGRVEAVGAGVTRFSAGDEVYGELAAGAFAEYAAVPESALAPKPAGLSFEQAAAVPLAGFTALQAVRDRAGLRSGQHLLINGASGGVGTLAVQIAKWLGAEVTGVCSSANVDLVRTLGADHVVDYTSEDFAAGPTRYDAVLDNVGNRTPSEYQRVLRPKGIYVASHGRPENEWLGPLWFLARMSLLSLFVGQKMTAFTARPDPEDLATLSELIEAGDMRPVIDRTHPLAEVPDAFAYLEQWHARGKVVISV